MLVQITSGRGPLECELAVGLYLGWLRRRDINIARHEKYKQAIIALGCTYIEFHVRWRIPDSKKLYHNGGNSKDQRGVIWKIGSIMHVLYRVKRDSAFSFQTFLGALLVVTVWSRPWPWQGMRCLHTWMD